MLKWLVLVLIIGFPLDSYTCHGNDTTPHPAYCRATEESRRSTSASLPENEIDALRDSAKIVEEQIRDNDVAKDICSSELGNLETGIDTQNRHFQRSVIDDPLNNCERKIEQRVNNITSLSRHSSSGGHARKWYDGYLRKKEYEKDFEIDIRNWKGSSVTK